MKSILFCIGIVFLDVALGFTARFCTLNDAEDKKCQWMSSVLLKKAPNLPLVECVRGQDSYDCLQMLEDGKVDIKTKTWVIGIYIGGKYHNLVPLLRENTNNDSSWTPAAHYIVAVVRQGGLPNENKLDNLRGARACFPGVYSLGGWQIPVGRLAERNLLPRTPCRDALAAVANFFNDSCAPGMSVEDRRRLPSLCGICNGESDKRCTYRDPYAGYTGAIKCLQDRAGDIAFVRHHTFNEMLQDNPDFATQKQELELLCLDGTRKSLDRYEECNWGAIPDYATVVSANMTLEHQKTIKDLLYIAKESIPSLFSSSAFGGKSVLFDDNTVSFQDVGNRDNYVKYAGDYYDIAEQQYPCSEPSVKFCVISEAERSKCRRWNDALSTRLLKPNVECVMATDKNDCLRLMREGEADTTLLGVEDIYKERTDSRLKAVMSEAYKKISDSDAPEVYDWAVAVVIANNSENITFTNLRGKKSCHPSVQSLTGWKIPAVSLAVTGQMNLNPCGIRDAMKQFFSQSCVPGVTNTQSQTNQDLSSLCALCEGEGLAKCSESKDEPFYGEEGALRCLTTGVGDVAFLKYSTLVRNVGGQNTESWAKHLQLHDFKLLCSDGSTKSVDEYKRCNLVMVPTSALVTRMIHDPIDDLVNRLAYLFRQSETFYGSKSSHDFNMFESGPRDRNLIFTDRIKGLQQLPERLQDPDVYVQNVKGYFQSTDEDRCSSGP